MEEGELVRKPSFVLALVPVFVLALVPDVVFIPPSPVRLDVLLSTVRVFGDVVPVPLAAVRVADVLLADALAASVACNEFVRVDAPDDVRETDELPPVPLRTDDDVLVPLRMPLLKVDCPDCVLIPPTPPKSLRLPYWMSRPYQ